MSYSISVSAVKVEDFDGAIDAAIDAYNWAGTNPDGELVARDVAELVKTIVGNRLVANPGQIVNVTIAGHANPKRDNEGTVYGRDSLSISVYQVEGAVPR